MWSNYAYAVPESRKVRYLIHSECKNEADDQYTVAHALMCDRLVVRGALAGHFDAAHGSRFAAGATAQASYDELAKILDLMHLTDQVPLHLGAPTALPDEHTPIDSPAAQAIIAEAMRDDPRPLYIGMQGALTDLASAILLQPAICERMTCIWIGGGDYPDGGQEFNLMNDINAANVVFGSAMPLWQVPKHVYKHFAVSLAELQIKVRPYGKIGRYLFDQLDAFNRRTMQPGNWPQGEAWTLGDEGCVCALMQEVQRTDGYTMRPAPRITPDMHYIPAPGSREIRVYDELDVRLDLEDLFAKLQINFPTQDA